jgi:hypothetical protein
VVQKFTWPIQLTTLQRLIKQTAYGYNFYYADNAAMAGQFVPTNVAQPVVTHPQATDIPNMAAFLGSIYTFGLVYDGSSLVGKNNPMFVNFRFLQLTTCMDYTMFS